MTRPCKSRSMIVLSYAILLTIASTAVANAKDAVDFYKDQRKISLIVGFGPGGGYDVYARLLARHMGRHIPSSPEIVVENMPGAGSLRATNHLFNAAPKDGSVIGTFERGMVLLGVMGNPNVRFNPAEFTWLGSLSSFQDDSYLLYVRSDSPFKSVSDLQKASSKPLSVGGTAPGAAATDVPILLREVLGLNIQVISGYPDGNAIYLALERGEVDGDTKGYSSLISNRSHWLQPNGPIRVLLQFGRETRHPLFSEVPTARELAKDDNSRSLIEIMELPYLFARPFVAPPNIPTDRAKALQHAFAETMKDKAFRTEAEKLKVDVDGINGDVAANAVKRVASQPKELLEKLKTILKTGG
jgi:tripartite-type tricarboxylate transporter receptor subunit TctC